MTEDQIADALVDWTTSILTDAALGNGNGLKASYSFLPQQKGQLPDVAATVEQKRISQGIEERLFFPLADLQQTVLRVFECLLSFMVESPDTPGMASDEAEQRLLRLYGATVEESVRADASLGGRLQTAFASPVMLVDYRLPFVQYQDGTRGRQATVVLAIGELVPDEETTF